MATQTNRFVIQPKKGFLFTITRTGETLGGTRKNGRTRTRWRLVRTRTRRTLKRTERENFGPVSGNKGLVH